PLTLKVLNLPGEGLRREIEKHDDGFYENAALAMMIGPIVLATWLLVRMDRVVPDWRLVEFGVGDATIVLLGASALAWCTVRLVQHSHKRRLYKQGLSAELAVAQCLMPLMADGLAVFHDFPADKFNIDHIVIGRSAVFAIETKSRKKPKEKGRQSARVSYDGERLTFPTHAETKPIAQAHYQAQWLRKFLNSGVGEPIRVIPVVALPGWYVESTASRAAVFVTNCHNPAFMAGNSFGAPFADEMRKRISHALIERYPDEPEP
ncbi:MAG: NERD domain-containing protein, partial [Pseudomonadota bacterium]|nr:NERD domain-containing protein [Pseudomonadota bacterium]